MHRELFEARRNAAGLFEQPAGPFDHIALPVGIAIELRASSGAMGALEPLIAPFGDHRLNPVRAQPAPHRTRAVAFVARHARGALPRAPAGRAADPHRVQYGRDELRLVRLPRTHRDAERQAVTVGQQVHLGPKPAAAPAEGVIGRFAQAGEESPAPTP